MPQLFTYLAAAATGLMAQAAAADFNTLDTDRSGTLSFAEIQSAAPVVTAEEFAAADADGSGELSRAEFDAWVASKPDQNA